MKYRHVVIRRFGGPEVLQVVEDDLAAPGSGQALVKVLAADVGFSDVNIRRGRYPRGPRPPFTPATRGRVAARLAGDRRRRPPQTARDLPDPEALRFQQRQLLTLSE